MMPAKTRTHFICQDCGHSQAKWAGRCPKCGEWNTMVEYLEQPEGTGARSAFPIGGVVEPVALPDVPADGAERIPLAIGEFARVLGGGIVPGAGVLISGDPGIGKSTLLLQMAAAVAQDGRKVLYVSGEESASQVKRRATRLGIDSGEFYLLADVNLNNILQQVERMQPGLIVVDSIQAVFLDALQSSAGSVSQVRECTSLLLRLAKTSAIPIFLVGHVTKEGSIAGPRVLEHMVDTVLYLEGDGFHSYRLLRSIKNRFGSTNEIGVFEMNAQGMAEVTNPSEVFLAERLPQAAGSAIAVPVEGTRPLLVEVQALASTTSFPQPRRTANGVDFNRLLLIVAVLSKRVGLRLADQDIFVNVIGGLKVSEPASDLAIAVSVASSVRNKPVAADLVLVGEVGLSGELRSVSQLARRLSEAQKLGFKRAVVPRPAKRREGGDALPPGIELIEARSLAQAIESALIL
ncbi:MAG: DNA repair protein RadA [Caldilineales bacterium]|nr:DNA repair protein RadA [Caldilineales bacterium]